MTQVQPNQPDGYLVMPTNPTSGSSKAVLVLHAWWGLNDTIKEFCARLAHAGFTVFAPDLYHSKIAKTIPEAESCAQAVDSNPLQVKSEVKAAAQYLFDLAGNPTDGITVIGFSLGAYFSLDLSNADPDHVRSVVVFYGSGVFDYPTSQASYLGHFAENDPYEPKENVDGLEYTLKAAGRPVTIYRYSGTGHWFFEPDVAPAYNPEAAALAWDRTLAFLRG